MKYDTYEGFQKEDADLSILMDGQGRHRTASLFLESISPNLKDRADLAPIYTLRNRDYNNLPSAYLIYMASVDEFDAAMKIVGSMSHWRKLISTKWFMDGGQGFEGLTVWREDMALRDRSIAKRELIKSAGKGDTSSARKLFDLAAPEGDKKSVGRPSTKASKKAEEEAAQQSEEEALIAKLHSKKFGDGHGDSEE